MVICNFILEIIIKFKHIPEWKNGNLAYFDKMKLPMNPGWGDDRDKNMANKIDQMLHKQNENGKLFVGIGSAHLLHVAQYLREKGWTMQKM
jgi:TraB/PrgY/gumN family